MHDINNVYTPLFLTNASLFCPVDLPGSEESDVSEDEGPVKKRRRRRRKIKADNAAEGQAEDAEGRNEQNLEDQVGQERLSKNKKRKLKKKRQKEKLRSLGLAPQSRAVEFTFRQDGGEKEEGMDGESSQKVDEVLDFLRTTWNIYLSDRKSEHRQKNE